MNITPTSNVRAIIKTFPASKAVFERHGLLECGGQFGPREPLGFFAMAHGVDIDELIEEVKTAIGGENDG